MEILPNFALKPVRIVGQNQTVEDKIIELVKKFKYVGMHLDKNNT